MNSLAENIERIRDRIATAAERYGRPAADVTLIAVTKTVSEERIREAKAAGVYEFGENYVQDARRKINNIAIDDEHTDICCKWHLIGHLQTNKVKYSVELFSLIHSVDNYQLVQEINRQAAKRGKVQEILIEVNLQNKRHVQASLPEHWKRWWNSLRDSPTSLYVA
jgi:hypothetical protein